MVAIFSFAELKTFHNSLSRHLFIHKVEKYLLLFVVSLIITQIPYNVNHGNISCAKVEYSKPTKADSELCADSTNIVHIQYTTTIDGRRYDENLRVINISSACFTLDNIDRQHGARQCAAYLTIESLSINSKELNNVHQKSEAKKTKLKPHKVQFPINYTCDGEPKNTTTGSNSKYPANQGIEEEHDCQGQRAYFMALSLSTAVLFLIIVFVGHDTWLEISEQEINELKKFKREAEELGICEICAKNILQRNHKSFCDRCSSKPQRPIISIQDIRKKRLQEYPPQTGFLDAKYQWQNVITGAMLLIALFIFMWAAEHNVKGHNCQEYSVVCHDKNRHIADVVRIFVVIGILILLMTAVMKFVKGTPYRGILKAFPNDK